MRISAGMIWNGLIGSRYDRSVTYWLVVRLYEQQEDAQSLLSVDMPGHGRVYSAGCTGTRASSGSAAPSASSGSVGLSTSSGSIGFAEANS